MPTLTVWMNGELVGEWITSRRTTAKFTYAQEWVESRRARALSLSLPITAAREVIGPRVDHYFDNLLPDNPDIRSRIRDRLSLRSSDAFDLLEAIGRDCVGAVQILPTGDVPERWQHIDAQKLSDVEVEQLLLDVTSPRPLGGLGATDGEFRISIAGAQEKTALLYMSGAWHKPLRATPTTHILKLPLGIVGNFRGDFSNSVENEWLCGQFLRSIGLPTADSDITAFGEQRVLAVRRFDRRWVGVDQDTAEDPVFTPAAGQWIARLPQEDFCQATARPPAMRYEADGGASVDEILDVLATSSQAEIDQQTFILAQLAFWLLAATDGHAKNFSISHRANNQFSLTPLYDVLSAWPVIGSGRNQLPYQDAKLAMALAGRNRHYRISEIQARHFHQLLFRVGGDALWQKALQLVEAAPIEIERLAISLPPDFPAVVAERIAAGIAQQAQRFLLSAQHV